MSLDTYDSIFDQFPAVSSDEWKNKILKDLKGEPFDKLIWNSKEGIDVLPFYTKEDNLLYQLHIPERQQAHWQITERITVNDIISSNKEALLALQSGTTTLIFDLQKKNLSVKEVKMLVKDIILDIAPVYFENYNTENKIILESVVEKSCIVAVKIPAFETITEELVYALQHGISKDATSLFFHFPISQNYAFEIAKLRAFRWLWKQVSLLNKKKVPVFILSETGLQRKHDANEYINILSNTTEAMSAILGGCDALLINSHNTKTEDAGFGKRIARNIHHILQYESYFSEIEDVVKGSYYLEYLTFQLSKKSWEKFINN